MNVVIPERIKSILRVLLVNLAMFTLFRYAFLFQFRPHTFELFSQNSLTSFYIGLKFDCRLSVFLVLPILVLSWVPFLDMTRSKNARRFWNLFQTIIMLAVLSVYFTDFGNYSYLNTRINATVLTLLENPEISGRMLWQSYPIVKLTILLLLTLVAYYFFINRSPSKKIKRAGSQKPTKLNTFTTYLVFIVLLFLIGYGKIARFPLRWSDAFFSTDSFLSQFTLNPVLSFVESFREEPANYDIARVKKYYPIISDFYNIDPTKTPDLLLHRDKLPEGEVRSDLNVVIILMETFAAFKTGTFGNEINPSPHFDSLAEEGILFTRYFTPMENTSRSIFALLFGIPDVSQKRSSSRNPLVVEQHTIINSFKEHKKYYFIGGSASWGNIRGMLSHNIDELTLFEEGDYSAPIHDVWGISDEDLFEEANSVLKKENKPFFAVIQTAGNHRPYKIPKNTRDFKILTPSEESVKKNGFISVAEYNHFRLLDHSLGYFFNLAKKAGYYKDTLFIIMGDHGTTGGAVAPRYGSLSLEVFHVPLLFYAPGVIKTPRRVSTIASELDVLPSVAGFMGVKYRNQTFGKNLFSTEPKERRMVFTFSTFERPPRLGLLSDTFYLNVNSEGKSALYKPWSDEQSKDFSGTLPELTSRMADHAKGVYEMSKYLLYNNRTVNNSSMEK